MRGYYRGSGRRLNTRKKKNDKDSAVDTERPRQRGLAQLAIGACLALGGCASQPDRLPIEAGDVCGGQRAELAKFQGYYGTVIAPGIDG